MKQILNAFGFISVFIVYFTVQVVAQDVCVKKTPCSCEFPNGTGIDLSPIVAIEKSTFYTTQSFESKDKDAVYELSTYYYHPCVDVKPNVNSTSENDTCGVPLSICRHVNTMKLVNVTAGTYVKDSGTFNFLGQSNVSDFSADGRSIIYPNGPSSTVVMLVCSESANELHVLSLEEPNRIVLSFYSPYACMKQLEQPGRSLGSTLLIIFFSCVIFYLVLGICTKKFLMGATGIEVIPNLGFWSDLPHLVKDGWAFTINGFKLPARGPGPVTTPDPNSYDSI
ncbi:uncharacterized protein [Epargyreus clarus]|uniref:uncharacterized protein n=1 Tax=Epargyreus clarus TaxID=520877 RepID=UPI003C2E7C7B